MMKDLLRAYQTEGDREIIEKVLKLVETDLRAVKYKDVAPQGIDGLFYIAYRIRAFMLNNCLAKMKAKNLTEKSFRAKDYNELQGYIKALFENGEHARRDEHGHLLVSYEEFDANSIEYDEYEFNFAEIRQNNFESIRSNFHEVTEILPYSYIRVFELIDRFQDLDINSEEFQNLYTEVKAELIPLFTEALEQALLKVDADREPKEIVKYVNKVMLSQFIKLLQKHTGYVRIYETATKKEYYVKPTFEHDAYMLMFGKTLKHVGLDNFDKFLTKKQKQLIIDTYTIIDNDLKSENTKAFKWNKDGTPRINKKYLAEQVGKTEGSFKKMFYKCEHAINENWKEAMDAWRKSY